MRSVQEAASRVASKASTSALATAVVVLLAAAPANAHSVKSGWSYAGQSYEYATPTKHGLYPLTLDFTVAKDGYVDEINGQFACRHKKKPTYRTPMNFGLTTDLPDQKIRPGKGRMIRIDSQVTYAIQRGNKVGKDRTAKLTVRARLFKKKRKGKAALGEGYYRLVDSVNGCDSGRLRFAIYTIKRSSWARPR